MGYFLFVVVLGVAVFFSAGLITAFMVIIVAIAFGWFAGRPPQVLQYSIDEQGIMIGSKHYNFSAFKSFSILEDGAIHSILLMPLQRLMPSITIYFAPEDEQKILDVISGYLPFEARQHDLTDKIMRKIRF